MALLLSSHICLDLISLIVLTCSYLSFIFIRYSENVSFIFNQGGKFDHADRLFQSIGGTFKNCLSNTSDVKELIPEFFYTPEFLLNSNSYHFGVKQDGEPIGDVCLPPWAKVCAVHLNISTLLFLFFF